MASLVKKKKILYDISKWFLFCFPGKSTRNFSDIHCDNLVAVLEVHHTKLWELPGAGCPGVFKSKTCSH